MRNPLSSSGSAGPASRTANCAPPCVVPEACQGALSGEAPAREAKAVSELEGRGAAWTDAPKGRGAAWIEERGTSDEGRRRLKGAPEAHRKQSMSDEGRRRSEGGMGRRAGPRKRAGDTA